MACDAKSQKNPTSNSPTGRRGKPSHRTSPSCRTRCIAGRQTDALSSFKCIQSSLTVLWSAAACKAPAEVVQTGISNSCTGFKWVILIVVIVVVPAPLTGFDSPRLVTTDSAIAKLDSAPATQSHPELDALVDDVTRVCVEAADLKNCAQSQTCEQKPQVAPVLPT